MAFDLDSRRFVREFLPPMAGKHALTLGRLTDCTTPMTLKEFQQKGRGFAEHELGCASVESVDVSDFEGATYIADLGLPVTIPKQFDLIWDPGTIEHVFDIAQCLRNVSALLKPGGYFVTQQNLNLIGHGFYSIAPEALYKWAKCSGYDSIRCFVYRQRVDTAWREIAFKDSERVEFFLLTPARYFFVCRRPLAHAPQWTQPKQAYGPHMPLWRFWLWHTGIWRHKRVKQ